MSLFKKLFLLLRVPHWSKNFFVLLGVIYADSPSYWGRAILAALAFSLIASAVYIYNDLQDIEEDKVHPLKSQRLLARGDVSLTFALTTLIILLILGYLICWAISGKLIVIISTYLLINLFYNHWLRRVPMLDVLCIASGFMLRILAGTLGIGLPITWWLSITATLLCLFIALCKRRLEIQMGLKQSNRAVLRKYSPQLLDNLIIATACCCFFTYFLYTMYACTEFFYFLMTLPFCAIGLWRFANLATKDSDNDDPMMLFIHDHLSRLNLLCFFALTVMGLLQ